MPSSSVAIATIVDHRMWTHAAVLVQQLVDLETRLPIVVFNLTAFPWRAVRLIRALGGRVASLEPAMPVPASFGSPLLPRPFIRDGAPVLGRVSPWAKLAVWGQTAWEKVVLLDVDVVLLRNIDEMAAFPADTFSPETCNSMDPKRCSEAPQQVTAGFNAGVLVAGPSEERFSSMAEFATGRISELIRAASDKAAALEVERLWLHYPEQSFLKQYWPAVMNATIVGGGSTRAGYEWQPDTSGAGREWGHGWRTLRDRRACVRAAGTGPCVPPASHWMSRLYNARPYDCHTCSERYNAQVRIVHYTCGIKPWNRPMGAWQYCAEAPGNRSCKHHQPCTARWTLRWHVAHQRVCARAAAVGAAEAAGCAVSKGGARR